METVIINGIEWRISFVGHNSRMLFRSDGSHTIGMTDGNLRTMFLSDRLSGAMLEKVICHELCHCICFSYNIHIPIQQEEFLAEWISLYGREVIRILDDLLKKISTKA